MIPRHKLITATAVAACLLLLVAWLSGCSLFPTPADEPIPIGDIPTEGTTNLSDLVLAGDLTVGDDLTVTDDTTFTDDVSLGGDLTTAGYIKIGSGTPNTTLDGADLYVEGSLEVDDILNLDSSVSISDTLGVGGATVLNGGLTMDTNKFTVADGTGNTSIAGTANIGGAVTLAYDVENIRLPSIMSETIITSTDGALWTIADGEIWYIHAVFCHVTTNFDCDGDDCTLNIGDGNDADGLLDLDDGELQTTDTEGTGAPAGWQGFMSGDTAGAYLVNGVGFIYSSTETIDIAIEDASGHTDPTAGAATCYLVYTRLE